MPESSRRLPLKDNDIQDLQAPQPSGFINAFWLKLIAIVAMAVDHIAWSFFPPYVFDSPGFVMRFFGKLTFPIMCFFIAEGYRHSSNIKKYLGRLGIFALISIIPYTLSFGVVLQKNLYGMPIPNNVFFTLFFGLLSLYLTDFTRDRLLRFMIVATCAIASSIGDWPVVGVPMIYLFGRVQGNGKRVLSGVSAFIGLYVVGFLIDYFTLGSQITPSHITILGALLTIPLLLAYNGKRGANAPVVKHLFYWFYPIHLLILFLIRYSLYGW